MKVGANQERLLIPMPPLPNSPVIEGKPVILLSCTGTVARDLFAAVELLAVQRIDPSGMVWRTAGGISCNRFPASEAVDCTIEIDVSKPFLDAVQGGIGR
jgi:hypothetical protein